VDMDQPFRGSELEAFLLVLKNEIHIGLVLSVDDIDTIKEAVLHRRFVCERLIDR